jgi:hypothetical protein
VDVETLEQLLRNSGFTTKATQRVDGEEVDVWMRQYIGVGEPAQVTLRRASQIEVHAALTDRLPEEHVEAIAAAGVVHWQCRIEAAGWTSTQARTASEVFNLHNQFLAG